MMLSSEIRPTRVHALLIASLALGGAVLTWREFVGPRPPVTPPAEATSLPARDPSTAPLQLHAAHDALPEDWDGLEREQRVEHLEARFIAALAAIEAVDNPGHEHIFTAQAALTAMRPELYSTTAGRARHRDHERSLSHALGESGPGTGSASR